MSLQRFNPFPAFNVIFLVLFSILTLCVALAPTINKFGLYQPALIIFSLATVTAASLMVFASYRPGGRVLRAYPWLVAGALLVSLAVQLIVARALLSEGYSWDSELIFKEASHFALNGSLHEGFIAYLRDNPNNIALVTILGVFFKGLHHLGVQDFLWPATLLNVAVLFLTQLVTFATALLLYGKRVAAVTLLFGFAFVGLSMFVQTPYTDTLTIIFPVSILFLSILFVRSKHRWIRAVLSALIGLITVVGYLVKPTVVIACIALLVVAGIWLVISKHSTPWPKKWALAALYSSCAVLFGAAALFGFGKSVDAIGVLPYPYAQAAAVAKPPLHYVAMGMRSSVVGNSVNYGGYDSEMTNTIVRLQSPEAKRNFATDAIRRQLQDYGPLGYADFLGHKAKWIASDATFFAYGEGSNKNVTFRNHDRLSTAIRQFMYVDGRHYQLFGNALQVLWVALLLLITMQLYFVLMNRQVRYNAYATILRLMLAGILVFLLLFEGRARYLFLYVPIFILLGMHTLQLFKENDRPEPSDT